MANKRKRSLDVSASTPKNIFDETASPRSKRVRKSKVLSDDFMVYGTTSNNSSATYFRSKLSNKEEEFSEEEFSDSVPDEEEQVEELYEPPSPVVSAVSDVVSAVSDVASAVSDVTSAVSDADMLLRHPEVIVVLERLTDEVIEKWRNPVKPEKRGRGRPPKSSKRKVPVIRTKQKLIRIIKDGRTKVIQPLDKRERLAVEAKLAVKKVPANIAEPPKRKPCKPKLKPGAKFRAANAPPVAKKSEKPVAPSVVKKEEDGNKKSVKKDDKKEDAPPMLKVSGSDKNKDEEYVLCMNEDGQLLYVPTNVAMSSSTGSVRAQVTLPTDEEKAEKDASPAAKKKKIEDASSPVVKKKMEKDTGLASSPVVKKAAPKKAAPKKEPKKKEAKKKKPKEDVTDILVGSSKEDEKEKMKKSELPKATTKKPTKKFVPEGKGGKDAKGQDFVLCYNKVEDEYVYISRDLIKPKKDDSKGDTKAKPKAKKSADDKPKAKVINIPKKLNPANAKKLEGSKKIVVKTEAPRPRAELVDDIFNARPMRPAILPVKKVTSQYLKPPVVEKKPLVFNSHYITPRDVSRSAQGTVLLDPTTDEVITVKSKPEPPVSSLTDATAALLKIGQGLHAQDVPTKAEEPATDDSDWINVFINGSQSDSQQNVVALQSEEDVVRTPVATSAAETVLSSSQDVVYEGSANLADGQILTTVDGQFVVSSADQPIVEQRQEQFIMAQDSQVVVTTSASDPVSTVVYKEPQEILEQTTSAAEVVYEQQADIMPEAASEVVYEQPQDQGNQVIYEQDPDESVQDVVYEQQHQEVMYEQQQEPQQEPQQDVVYEQEEQGEQQEVVYEQPKEEAQNVVYEQQEVVYEQQEEQQEVVYEQPNEEAQNVVYEQQQEEHLQQQEVVYEQPEQEQEEQVVYENGMPHNAQIDYSQVAQQMEEPQAVQQQQPQLDYSGITESPATTPASSAAPSKAKSRAIIVVGDTSYVVESDTPIVQNGTIDQNVLSALMNSNRQAKPSSKQARTLFTHQSPNKSASSPVPPSGRSLLRTNLLPGKQQTVMGDLGSLQGLLTPPTTSSSSSSLS